MIVKTTRQFEKNVKKLIRSGAKIEWLNNVVESLVNQDMVELNRLNDHALQGVFSLDREIHIGQRASNWVLRYRIEADVIILLLATGTHGDVLNMK